VVDSNLRIRSAGISPLPVFDGAKLPGKTVNQDRAKKQQAAYKKVEQAIAGYLLKNPTLTRDKLTREQLLDTGLSEADFQAALSVTSEFVRLCIDGLRATGIVPLVAPYEADAQLAYLSRVGLVDFVLSKDMDMLVYGVENFITEISPTGDALLYRYNGLENMGKKFEKVPICQIVKKYGLGILPVIAALFGCDYGGIPGIGETKGLYLLNSAYKLSSEEKKNQRVDLARLAKTLQPYAAGSQSEDDITNTVQKIVNIYNHQVVFDPRTQQRVCLTPYNGALPAYCGELTLNRNKNVVIEVVKPQPDGQPPKLEQITQPWVVAQSTGFIIADNTAGSPSY
jgi:exonuclease-1